MNIKVGSNLKTRRGRAVEVIYVFPEGKTDEMGYSIVGLLAAEPGDDGREICTWRRDGKFGSAHGECMLDLDLSAFVPPFEVQIGGLPITLTQQGRDRFTVTYWKQVKTDLPYATAADELGGCILHALACNGAIDNREPGE